MAVTPNSMILPQAIRHTSAVCTVGKTTYNDGTNAVLLVAGGANNSFMRRLTAIPRATIATNMQLQLYSFDGTNYNFIDSVLMTAYTMAQTTAVPVADFGYSDSNVRYLPSGLSFYVAIGISQAAGIVFNAGIGDY